MRVIVAAALANTKLFVLTHFCLHDNDTANTNAPVIMIAEHAADLIRFGRLSHQSNEMIDTPVAPAEGGATGEEDAEIIYDPSGQQPHRNPWTWIN